MSCVAGAHQTSVQQARTPPDPHGKLTSRAVILCASSSEPSVTSMTSSAARDMRSTATLSEGRCSVSVPWFLAAQHACMLCGQEPRRGYTTGVRTKLPPLPLRTAAAQYYTQRGTAVSPRVAPAKQPGRKAKQGNLQPYLCAHSTGRNGWTLDRVQRPEPRAGTEDYKINKSIICCSGTGRCNFIFKTREQGQGPPPYALGRSSRTPLTVAVGFFAVFFGSRRGCSSLSPLHQRVGQR